MNSQVVFLYYIFLYVLYIWARAVERSKNLEGLAVIEGLLMENDLLLLLPKSEKAITPFAPPAPTAL